MRDEEIDTEKIITFKDATYAAEERKPEEIHACQDLKPDLCDTGAAL